MIVQQLEAETDATTQIHVCYGSICGITSLSLSRRNCMIGNLVSCQAGSRGRGRYRYGAQCTVYSELFMANNEQCKVYSVQCIE